MSFHTDNTNKHRCEYIDCVKGVAILSITFLHFENGVIPPWLNTWIGMFMITAFYVTSGWVFGLKTTVDTPKTLFRKRLRQLGTPYLWFAILIIAFDLIWAACGFMEPEIIVRDIYKWVTLRGIGTLWFLPALMFGEILFCCVISARRPILTGGILFTITLISSYLYDEIWWMQYRNANEIYQLIDAPIKPVVSSLAAWPIIGIGYLLSRRYNRYFNDTHRWPLALIGTIILIISLWLVIAPPFHVFYINGILSNILPAIGFMGVFTLIGTTPLGRFFSYWGRNSLIMMCLHFSIIMEIILVIDKYVIGHESFTGWPTILYSIISVLAIYPLVPLFNGKLSFMLGKTQKQSSK